MKIGILDYGLGNIGSVQNMLRKLGANVHLEHDPSKLFEYEALVLPGVGAFDAGVIALKESGFDAALKEYVKNQHGYLLGICLGMQLLLEASEEGELPGLGFIEGKVKRFDFEGLPDKVLLKTPHMGWNEVLPKKQSSLFTDLDRGSRFYFVHSYHAACCDEGVVLASANYGYEFTCAIRSGNVLGAQFHPEKSHRFGLQFFRNFLAMVENDAS